MCDLNGIFYKGKLNLEDISQNRTLLGRLLGIQNIIEQGIGHLHPVEEEVVQSEIRTQIGNDYREK